MHKTKEVVNQYLIENFDKLQSARHTPGFSWVPILLDINKKHNTDFDPSKERDRDYVRGRFLSLRKRRNNFAEGIVVQASETHSVYVPKEALKDTYKYIDTYTKVTETPKNEQEEFQQWKQEKNRLKSQVGLHIVAGCIHFPAVNQKFYKAFLQFIGDVSGELKGIHLIGDILDCKSLSQHDKGMVSDTNLEEEYTKSNQYLDMLDSSLPSGIEKNYIWGNHEERYTRLQKQVDISKFGKALLSPTAGCHFIERGYTVQEDYQNAKIQLGKYLDLIHGQYVVANACKKHLDVYKKSIMFAHTHKMGSHFDTDKAAFNIGWMGDSSDKAFGYCSRVTKEGWQNGFAVVNIDESGFYHVQMIQFFNGRFYYGGKEYCG
jgi:hypothetical protein